jgi:hypothetical protein
MKTHRLIPIIVVLFILGVATMTTIRNSPVALDSGTTQAVEAQTDQVESDGFSSTPGADTKTEVDTDLYLDADEVEKRAAEEQSGTSDTTASPSRVPVSFKNVAIPLPGGIDHAVAGVATRNSGQGVIRLRGIPPGSTLINAFLVWGEIDQAAVANYPVVFGPDCANGAAFFGQNFGNSPQPCWNGAGTFFPYITNVTPQILPGINGDYRVSRLHSALTDNRCPWGDGGCAGPGNKLPLSEGASLIVVYSNPCIPRGAQLYIHLGPGTFSGAHTATHFTLLNPIKPNFPNLKHSRIGADGQVGGFNCGLRSIPQISDERTWIENPATGGSIQIKGDVAGLNRDSDWNGYDGEPLNKLWDSHTDVFANSNFLAAGPPGNQGLSYRVRYLSQGDCISWVVHILGVR